MVVDLALYTIVHQPRRLKFPAQPIPRGATAEEIAHCLFDEHMTEQHFRKVAQSSYYPGLQMFQELVKQGLKLSIGFSQSFIRQAAAWDGQLLDQFRELVAHENVELIGVDPYQSVLSLLDLPAFVTRMQEMAHDLETVFGKRPVVVDATALRMSASLYDALDAAGFQGALMDGSAQVLEWREPTYLYHYGEEAPLAIPIEPKHVRRPTARRKTAATPPRPATSPFLLTRHAALSDDVACRFSDYSWNNFPLFADKYADWIARSTGDLLLLEWDFATFGERHRPESGIFDFMRALPHELELRGVETHTASELIARHADHANHLPLPISSTTRDNASDTEVSVEGAVQQNILQLMSEVYGLATLSHNPEMIDLALWLAQSANLHAIQWYGRSSLDVDVSVYFPSSEWWQWSPERLLQEQQQIYINALNAMQPYLPSRLLRYLEQERAHRTTAGRRKEAAAVAREPELSFVARYA